MFRRNEFYYHVRLTKKLRFTNPTAFMANNQSVIDEAWPGDVVGLYDTGAFKIGDTLTEGEHLEFKGIPRFSPEIFRRLVNKNPFKAKQMEKGIRQLTDEGVVQLLTQEQGNVKIVGAVGELQIQVLQFRLLHEYGAECDFEALDVFKAFWVASENRAQLGQFLKTHTRQIAFDKDGLPIFLAEGTWSINVARERFQDIVFHENSEFQKDEELLEIVMAEAKAL